MDACPVCGTAGGNCGHQALSFPPVDLAPVVGSGRSSNMAGNQDTRSYLPRQKTRVGRPGYKGKDIVVVDVNRRGAMEAQTPADDDAQHPDTPKRGGRRQNRDA